MVLKHFYSAIALISFGYHNVGDLLLAIIGAFLIRGIVNYGIKAYQLKDNKTELKKYHWGIIKQILVIGGLLLVIWLIIL